jgi:hypothetical protein
VWYFTARPGAATGDFARWGIDPGVRRGAVRVQHVEDPRGDAPGVPEGEPGVWVGAYWLSGDPELLGESAEALSTGGIAMAPPPTAATDLAFALLRL